MSIVRGQNKDQIPHWIYKLPRLPRDWSSLEQTLEGHSGVVRSVAFSPDGSRLASGGGGSTLASGGGDCTVRVWNVATGQVEQTLEGHSDLVRSVAFSPNGSESYSLYSANGGWDWIIQNGARVLYLPRDYQPSTVATEGSTVAIGAGNGRVMIIAFPLDIKAGNI
jgi:WD40 repeat protein